ncbi:hypothetical protein [Geminisphaera colitermitum]|nr:hypothetical protein [Geminisphaera colitermitum]
MNTIALLGISIPELIIILFFVGLPIALIVYVVKKLSSQNRQAPRPTERK